MTFNPPFAYPGCELLASAAASDGGVVPRRCWSRSPYCCASLLLSRDESAGLRGTLLPERNW